MKNKAVAYVDGSYNKSEKICGWGVVFFMNLISRNILAETVKDCFGMFLERLMQRCLPWKRRWNMDVIP